MRNRITAAGMLSLVVLLAHGCNKAPKSVSTTERQSATAPDVASAEGEHFVVTATPTGPMRLSSPAFDHGDAMPTRHTCDGKGLSPALEWNNLPVGTMSLALVLKDQVVDSKRPGDRDFHWVHWLLYNLPARARGLTENSARSGLPAGTIKGINSKRSTGYFGPCRASGKHNYTFTLYALDNWMGDLGPTSADDLQLAIEGHILGQATLAAAYQRAAPSQARRQRSR